MVDADDFGDDAGDLGWGVELAFAFAAFGGEVAHEVFTGVASPSARLREKSRDLFSKMAMRLVRRSTISLPVPSLLASSKSGISERWAAVAMGPTIFLLIWSPMSGLPLRATMSLKEAPGGMAMGA